MELRAFLELNAAMALRALLDQVQTVERAWAESPARREALERLRDMLEWAGLHRNAEVRELHPLLKRLPADPSYQQFLVLFVPIERAHGRLVTDADFLIRRDDLGAAALQKPRLPLILILDNIRSVFNIGSILRSAESLGLEKVYLCGYSARPDQDKVSRAALGAEAAIDWAWHAHVSEVLNLLHDQGIPVYGFETAERAVSLDSWQCPQKKLALLFGNERYGLEHHVLSQCEGVIEIEARGQKNSLNVAVSAGIACFEVRRQWLGAAWLPA